MAKYSDEVMGMVRQRLGAEDENDTSKDDKIESMSKHEVFAACLEWEGIIGYDYKILGWINNIFLTNL